MAHHSDRNPIVEKALREELEKSTPETRKRRFLAAARTARARWQSLHASQQELERAAERISAGELAELGYSPETIQLIKEEPDVFFRDVGA